ncbi:hypothetical protein Tco_0008819 [Tanacetum coccineum]
MMTLQFADTHNLVTFLAKPAESEGFEQIVDFLNAYTIKYALIVNPTIYTSCIEQFWATVKVKNVNEEVQLQALVDGKKIIVTEASVRRDLQLDNEEGMDCLPNATIFKELTRMGAKTIVWNEFSSTMAFAIICLATNQKFNFSKYIFENMVKKLENVSGKFLMYPRFVQVFLNQQLDGKTTHKRIYVTPSHTKKIFGNIKRVGKGFSGRETPLFPTMVVQAQEEMGEGSEMPTDLHHTPIIIQPLSSQPQKKQKSRSPKKKDTQNTKTAQAQEIISLKLRVKKLEKKGGSRTHKLKRLYKGRKIDDIDKDAKITLVDETQGSTDKAGKKRNIVEEAVDVTDVVTIPISAATITNVELSLAQTLIELNSARLKTKGVVMQEPSESTPIISLQLASQAQEQQELTIKEKSTLFIQLLEKRKKHFVAKRAEEKRNMPPTRAQQRSIMCTYLKNMAGWKPKDLKNKSFANIQELFDKAMKRVNTFVDIDTELVEGSEVRAEGSETREESGSKRARDELEQEKAKKWKVDEEKETVKLQSLMKVIPDEEEVAVDAIPLATKPLSIVDCKILKEGKISYYQIIRADGSSKRYPAFIQMLRSFDREDLETLWKLVKAKHGYTRPEEVYERVLWGDLKTIVHFVRFQSLHVFLLVEKRYPLTSAIITEMLNKKLQADHWNEMGGLLGIKRLIDDLRVTTAKLMLLVYKLLRLMLKVNAAGIKVTTAKRLQLLEEFM